MMMNDKKPRLVYGRRRGKPLSVSRTEVMENLYPLLAIPRDILKQDKTLSPADIFNAPVKTLHVEIGFGNGEHLKWRMEKNPDDHFIGAEIFRDGVAAFLKSIKDEPHYNARVWMDDALIVLNSLPDASVDFVVGYSVIHNRVLFHSYEAALDWAFSAGACGPGGGPTRPSAIPR